MAGGLCLLCRTQIWVLQPRVMKHRSRKSLVGLSLPLLQVTRVQNHPASVSCSLGNVLLPPCVAATSLASLTPSSPKHPACLARQLPNPLRADEGPVSSWRIDLTEEYQALHFNSITSYFL